MTLPRVVLDTNLIIAGRFNPGSASNRIINLCLEKRLQPVCTGRIKDENLLILRRVHPDAEYLRKIETFYTHAILVEPGPECRTDVCVDRSDNIYFEAALAGQAQYIISNDRHLLEHDGFMGIRVMRPGDFLRAFQGS